MADLLVAIVGLVMLYGFMAMVGEMLRGLGRLLSGKSGNDRTSRYPPSGIPPRGAPRLSEFRMQVVDTETESGEPFPLKLCHSRLIVRSTQKSLFLS